jgi:hypothetical protein
MYDQSFTHAVREREGEVDLLPGTWAGRAGRDEVAVEGLAGERADALELGRVVDVGRERNNAASVSTGARRSAISASSAST